MRDLGIKPRPDVGKSCKPAYTQVVGRRELADGEESEVTRRMFLSANCGKTTKTQREIRYDAASNHKSEVVPLSTRDLKGTSPLRSALPLIVRWANLMLDSWPALHTVSGVFEVFLRDSIKRLTISGMMLPALALANEVGQVNTEYKTHNATPL